MLLKVWRHGRVAAQSLQLFPPHAAAAARRRRGGARHRGARRQLFGLFAGRSKVGVAVLQLAAYVVQQVVEKLGDALVTWKCRRATQD